MKKKKEITAMGIDGFLAKPFKEAELLKLLNSFEEPVKENKYYK